jgi:hypothetical protein
VPIFWDAANQTELAFRLLTGIEAPKERYTESIGDKGNAYFEKLKACWNGGFRAELEKYAYCPQLTFDD